MSLTDRGPVTVEALLSEQIRVLTRKLEQWELRQRRREEAGFSIVQSVWEPIRTVGTTPVYVPDARGKGVLLGYLVEAIGSTSTGQYQVIAGPSWRIVSPWVDLVASGVKFPGNGQTVYTSGVVMLPYPVALGDAPCQVMCRIGDFADFGHVRATLVIGERE